MHENTAVADSSEIHLQTSRLSFPYQEIQDKVNFLSLVLPLVSWKNVEDEDYYEWIMCLPSAAAASAQEKTFNTWQVFCIMSLVVLWQELYGFSSFIQGNMFLLKLHIPNWETGGLSTNSAGSLTLTSSLILLHIRDWYFGTASFHGAVTLKLKYENGLQLSQ